MASSPGFRPGRESRAVQRRCPELKLTAYLAPPKPRMLLRIPRPWVRSEPVGAQHIDDGLDIIFSNRLASVRKKVFRTGVPPSMASSFGVWWMVTDIGIAAIVNDTENLAWQLRRYSLL